MVKKFKGIIRTFGSFFRAIYKFIDKKIVTPITKFFLVISDKFGNQTGKFEKWLTRKSTLIFVSLILSIAMFLYVDSRSNILIDSSAEVLYNQKVDVTYNAETYVIEGLPETVDVTLIGRKMDLYLAKQLSTGSITADLSNYGEGQHKISLNYESPIRSVDYKLDPSTVNITVYQKLSEIRSVNVEVINKNKLDSKLAISEVSIDQTEVTIKGAEHTLSEVATVKALVDINNLVDPMVGVMTLKDVNLVAYNSEGKVVDVEIVPKKVTASISIESPTKEVPVKVIPKGNVEFGKAIDSISTNLTKVTVCGEKAVLEALEYIPIEVDVTGLSENKDYTVVLSKPNGITEISETTAKVSIRLDEEVTKEFSDIHIETINLDSNYKAAAIGENSSVVSVVVKGTQNVLDSIDATMLRAVVDLSGYSEGDYEVEVKVTGEEVRASYVPKTTKIKVRISKK